MTYPIPHTSAVFICNTREIGEQSLQPSSPSLQQSPSFLPVEVPIDLEFKEAVRKNLIDDCGKLNPKNKIDKSGVISELPSCVNDELTNKHLAIITPQNTTEIISLKTIFQWVANTQGAELSITSFTFFGSSVLYKLADPIINAIKASEAKDIATPLFIDNLKRPPFDSDWKIVIEKPSNGSNISFWDAVECYTREILRNIARIKLGEDLKEPIDISEACELLGIDYEPIPGQFIHLSFRDAGIDLSIGCFTGEGLFDDTLPEVKVYPESFKNDDDNLKTELNEAGVDIFQAAVYRSFKILSVQGAENKNDRAAVQYQRRSLNEDICLSETSYPIFIDTLFKNYPISKKWAASIAKKFSNINKGHAKNPVDMILWTLFLFLSSLRQFPLYKIPAHYEQNLWRVLPKVCYSKKEAEKAALFHSHPLYQFFQQKHPAYLLEGILGLAGLLSLSLTESSARTSYSIRRHKGKDKPALCYYAKTQSQKLEIKLEPDLLTFCKSLKLFYENNPGYKGSEESRAVLNRFADFIDISNLEVVSLNVIKNYSSKLPCPTSECTDIAHTFILSPDPFLVLAGVSILMVLRNYPPYSVDEALLCYGIPVLLISDEQILKDFGIAYAKQLLSFPNIDSLFHPNSGEFLMPLWLNKLAATTPYSRIAVKHWMTHVSAEKKYFHAYTQFLKTLWNADPDSSAKLWEELIVHTFDEEQIRSLFELYANKLIDMPENGIPLNTLESFLHFINANISLLNPGVHGKILYKLVQKIAPIYPNGLTHCMSWLPFLPPEAFDVYHMGSIQNIVWKKIEEAKKPENKDSLFTFLHANAHLSGMFSILISPQLAAFFDADRLRKLFLSFIEKSTNCPRQKAHLALKLMGKVPFSELGKPINDTLDELLKQDPLPVSLLLKLFKSSFEATHNYAALSKLLLTFVEKLLTHKLNNLTEVAELVCKLDLPSILQNITVFDLLKRLVYEGTPKALNISITLAKSLKGASYIRISVWESLIEGLKLATYRQEKPIENFKKVFDFQKSFTEFEKAYYQTDLDLLALEIHQSDESPEAHLEALIAKKKELAKSEPLLKQLRLLTHAFIEKKLEKAPLEGIKWLKSLPCKQLLNEDERIELASKVVLKHFDEPLFTLILKEMQKASEKTLGSINFCAFADKLLEDKQHLYYDCENCVEKLNRLLMLHPYCSQASLGQWQKLLYIQLENALQTNQITDCIEFFLNPAIAQHINSDSKLANFYNALIVKASSETFTSFPKLVKSIGSHYEILTLETWKKCIESLTRISDKKNIENILSYWIAKYPFPDKNLLSLKSELEKKIHLEVIALLFSHPIALKNEYLKQTESIEYLISLFIKDSHVIRAKGLLLTHYTNKNHFDAFQNEVFSLLETINSSDEIILLLEPLCLIFASAIDKKLPNLYKKAFGLLKIGLEQFDNKKIKHAFQAQKTTLIHALTKCVETSSEIAFPELIPFLATIKEIIPYDSTLWLSILKILIEKNELFYNPAEKKQAFDLLGYIFSIFKNPLSATLLKDYKALFAKAQFEKFLYRLSENSDEIVPFLPQFYKGCLQHKILTPLTIQISSSYIVSKIVSHIDSELEINPLSREYKLSMLETLFNYFPFIYNHKTSFEVCFDAAIELTIDLFVEDNDITNFKLYSKKLLNHSFQPVNASKKDFFHDSIIHDPTRGIPTEKPFDATFFYKYLSMFITRMFNEEIIITKDTYEVFFELLSFHIFVLFTYFKIVPEEDKKNAIQWVKQLIYFPMLPTPESRDLINCYTSSVLIKASLVYYSTNHPIHEFIALRLYEILGHPVNVRNEIAFQDLKELLYIKIMANECLEISPLSFLNFVQNLYTYSKYLSPKTHIEENLELGNILIDTLKDSSLTPQFKKLCEDCILAIFDKQGILRYDPKTMNSDQLRLKFFSLQQKYIDLLVFKINFHTGSFDEKKNWDITLKAIEKRSYIINKDDHAHVFSPLNHFKSIRYILRNLTELPFNNISKKHTLDYCHHFIEILHQMRILIESAIDDEIKPDCIPEFLDFCLNTAAVKQFKDIHHPDHKPFKGIFLDILNLILKHIPDKQKAIIAIQNKLQNGNENIFELSDYYKYFKQEQQPDIPLLLHKPDEFHHKNLELQVKKLLQIIETLSYEDEEDISRLGYHLKHCFYFSTICKTNLISTFPLVLERLESTFSTNQFSLTLEWHPILIYITQTHSLSSESPLYQSFLLSAVEKMKGHDSEFIRLFSFLIEKNWFNDSHKERLEKLVESYLIALHRSKDIPLPVNPSLENCVRTLWEKGEFIETELLSLLVKNNLAHKKALELWKIGTLNAYQRQKYKDAITLVLMIKDEDLLANFSLYHDIVKAFLLNTVYNSRYETFFSLLFKNSLFTMLVERTDFREPILTFLKNSYRNLSFNECMLMLFYYKKTLLSIAQRPLLPVEIDKDFVIFSQVISNLTPNLLLRIWFDTFINDIKKNFTEQVHSELILRCLFECLKHKNLASLLLVPDSWPKDSIGLLNSLKTSFINKEMPSPAFDCLNLLVQIAPQEVDPKDKLKLYCLAIQKQKFMLAGKIALSLDLTNEVNVYDLLEDMFKGCKHASHVDVILNLLICRNVRAEDLLLKLYDAFSKVEHSKDLVNKYLRYIKQYESIVEIQDAPLRNKVWGIALDYLRKKH